MKIEEDELEILKNKLSKIECPSVNPKRSNQKKLSLKMNNVQSYWVNGNQGFHSNKATGNYWPKISINSPSEINYNALSPNNNRKRDFFAPIASNIIQSSNAITNTYGWNGWRNRLLTNNNWKMNIPEQSDTSIGLNKLKSQALANSPVNYFFRNSIRKEKSPYFDFSSSPKVSGTSDTSIPLSPREDKILWKIPRHKGKSSWLVYDNTVNMSHDSKRHYINLSPNDPSTTKFDILDKPKNIQICSPVRNTKWRLDYGNQESLQEEEEEPETLIKQYYCMSQAGKNEEKETKTNQDAYFKITELFGLKNFNIFCVLDGHGSKGNLVSNYVVDFLKKYFLENWDLKNSSNTREIYEILKFDKYNWIRTAFISVQNALSSAECEIDCRYSGTTCILLIQVGYKIISANVGDSKAIWIKGRKTIVPLSTINIPTDPEERKRIEDSGGEIRQFLSDGEPNGPMRVWKKGEKYPGIAMSRSLGDWIAKSIGVICDPVIEEIGIDKTEKYIILATDGIWEFLEEEKIQKIGVKYYKLNDSEGFCKCLVKRSTALWEQEDDVIDDITVISIFF